jgi:hypothetical protein
MEKKEAKPGVVMVQICKNDDGTGYRGTMEFDNGEVLAEALAVLMQQAAIKLGVSMETLYAKVASLLFPHPSEQEVQADE